MYAGTLGGNQMKFLWAFAYLGITSVVLLLSFQNCSPVKFSDINHSSLVASLNNNTNGILINRGATYANDTSALLQINVDAAVEMYITNTPDCSGGGKWQPAARETPWELGEKNRLTLVYAKFRANQQSETACINDSIIHDDIPPDLSLREPFAPLTKAPSTSIKLNMSDLGSGIDKLVCPADILPCTSEMTIANASEGPKNYDFYAIDRAGNRSALLSTKWLVDKTPPNVMFVATPATKTSLGSADFTVAATDNYSPASNIKFKCLIDSGAYQDCKAAFSFGGLLDGLHNVRVYAYDDIENASNPISYSWTIGRKIPTIRFTETPKPYTNIKGQFAFDGTDQFAVPLANFQCSLNNSVFAACKSPFILTAGLIEGENKFKIKGIDALGLESGELEYKWMYDTVKPIVAWITFPTEFTKNLNENLKISVSGDQQPLESIEFYLDNKVQVKSLADAYTLLALTEGFHTASVVVIDKAGNKSDTSAKTFWSDFTAPTLSYLPIVTPTKNRNVSLPVTTADNTVAPNNIISLFYILDEAMVNPAPYTLFTSPLDIKNIMHGLHLIKMYAVDKAGNKSIIYLSNPFLIDLNPPVITFLQQPSAEVSAGLRVTVEYLVQDIDSGIYSVVCKYSNMTAVLSEGPCSEKATLLLPVMSADTYVFAITATDKVGNISTKSIQWKTGMLYEQKTHPFAVTAQTNNKVDVLLVIDDSGSMQAEQEKIADAFSNFLKNLGGLNYRIGVTTTDTTSAGQQGSLLFFGGSNLTFIEPTTPYALDLLQVTVQTGIWGDGNEKGLTAIQKFIDKALTTSTNEYKFLRSDAIFATLVVTDADEAAYSGGYQSAKAFLDVFKLKLPGKTYIHHSSIVLPNDAACLTEGEEYGVTYFDLSKATGGISASLCSTSYVDQLKDFATTIINKISEQTLACAPIDINNDGTIDMSITYVATGGGTGAITSYTVQNSKVSFINPLNIVGDYTITYYCLK